MIPHAVAIVLIVEDEEDLRGALVEVLERAGFATRTACDGLAALADLRANPLPSLILLDLMMPRLDGMGVLAWMAAERIVVPVLVLSASRNPTLPAGVLLLKKPVAAVDLVAAIQATLQ